MSFTLAGVKDRTISRLSAFGTHSQHIISLSTGNTNSDPR